MTKGDLEALAIYNAEKFRGIVHTKEWEEWMRELQDEFNRESGGGFWPVAQ